MVRQPPTARTQGIIGIDGSPSGGGRTAAVLGAVLAAVPSGARTDRAVLAACERGLEEIVAAIGSARVVVFGTPVHRASLASPLKLVLDGLPRGMWGESEDPLRGKAVGMVATGATLHHFLALNDLRNVLSGFFAAHVLPPGLYVPHEGFDASGGLTERYMRLAENAGRGLGALAAALGDSTELGSIVPQA